MDKYYVKIEDATSPSPEVHERYSKRLQSEDHRYKYKDKGFSNLQHLTKPLQPRESRQSNLSSLYGDSDRRSQMLSPNRGGQSHLSSFLSHTANYLSNQIKPGSMKSAIISLIACTIGAGTLVIPYVFSISGLVGGFMWITIGAALTFYAGRLLIICGEITGKQGYERLAKIAFGKKWRPAVSLCMLISLIGFAVGYLTLIKTMLPQIIETAFGTENLPYWLRKNEIGGLFYSSIISLFVLLPLSMAKEISTLRFTSVLGVTCSLLVMVVVVVEFFTNDLVVPSIEDKIRSVNLFVQDSDQILEVIPFIVFLYMYQSVLPQSYQELERRSLTKMDKVVIRASMGIVFVYLIIGVFGYLTFADQIVEQLQNPKNSGNILECDYKGSIKIQFARVFLICAVCASAPFCFIPAKESYMHIIGLHQMTNKQNRAISIVLVVTTFILAIAVPNIKDTITLTGATVNPFIGFIFPILFFLKIDPRSLWSPAKLFAILVMIIIMMTSLLSLYLYFASKMDSIE